MSTVFEKVSYGGWKNCARLSNGKIEMIITLDVGPRVIRFGSIGKQNFMKEFTEQMGKTDGSDWRIYGGHRLWHAPEVSPRTYSPDNEPVEHAWNGSTLTLKQKVEASTGIGKEIEITMTDTKITLLHRLINNNLWDIQASVWCLTVLAPGGRAIVPQEKFIPHEEYFLPARPLVLWHYTNMADPRWIWGEKYIQLRQDPARAIKQKVGMLNTRGWAGYYLNKQLLVKKYACLCEKYPDMGSNTELFTNEDMLELETLAPLATIAANGGQAQHVEEWQLFDVEIGTDEKDIDSKVLPLIK